jgi:UDP-2,3-diacylglucosamine hydrolase
MATGTGGDLVFVGDVHLERDDAELPRFLAMLERLARTASRVVMMGDLFNLWIGRPELEQPHQTLVLDKLAELRQGGLTVDYVEGNRDYWVGTDRLGRALDRSSRTGLVEQIGGLRLFAIHGDLANREDRRYRAWHWFSHTSLLRFAFHALPARTRLSLADSLERRLRATNTRYKRAFPEAQVRHYAARWLTAGFDGVVLGHFHAEYDLVCGTGRVLVLPDWKSSRRCLRATARGELAFFDSEP